MSNINNNILQITLIKRILLGLMVVLGSLAHVTAYAYPVDDTGLTFYAPFDGDANATVSNADGTATLTGSGFTFEEGILGQALTGGSPDYVGQTTDTALSDNMHGNRGTFQVWVRPKADIVPEKNVFIFREDYLNNNSISQMHLWIWITANDGGPGYLNGKVVGGRLRWGVKEGNGNGQYTQIPLLLPEWRAGVWHLVTATWDKDKGTSLYVDGELIGIKDFTWSSDTARETFHLFSDDFAYDELQVYNRVLGEAEIQAEYNAYFFTSELNLSGAMAQGTTESYSVSVSTPRAGLAGTAQITIQDEVSNNTVHTESKSLVSAGAELSADFTFPVLPQGVYRVSSSVFIPFSGSEWLRHTREKHMMVIDSSPRVVPASDDQPAVTLLNEIDLVNGIDLVNPGVAVDLRPIGGVVQSSAAGDYLISGTTFAKDFISVELAIANPGKLHILEIDYPDDGDRQMSVSIHVDNASHANDLNGMPTGLDIPVSNTMKTYRTMFVAQDNAATPGDPAVVMIQNWWEGHSAAASRIRLYKVDELQDKPKLDKLLVLNRAAKARYIGHYSEDANGFQFNIDKTLFNIKPPAQEWFEGFDHLGPIMQHTGQNLFHFPAYWYGPLFYESKLVPETELAHNQVRTRQRQDGFLKAWLLSAQHYGYKLLFNIVPAGQRAFPYEIAGDINQSIADGWVQMSGKTDQPTSTINRIDSSDHIKLYDLESTLRLLSNPLYPAIEQLWWDLVNEIIVANKDAPALAGLSIRMRGSYASMLTFSTLESGYGDFTIGLYETETGVSVDNDANIDPADPSRYSKRYQYLTGDEGRKQAWIQWRVDKLTPRIKATADLLQSQTPPLPFYLDLYEISEVDPVTGNLVEDTEQVFLDYHREMGIDLDELVGYPGIVMLKRVSPNFGRHRHVYRNESDWEKWRPWFDSNTRDRLVSGAFFYNKYYETRSNLKSSWKDERDVQQGWYRIGLTAGGIQDTGRRFLRGYTRELAALDAKLLMTGGWGLEILGRENELREFSKAYLTLEDEDYTKVTGIASPVTIRERKAAGVHSFYVVNESENPVTLQLQFNSATLVRELTTDIDIVSTADGGMTLGLLPYSLRSFRIDNDTVTIQGGTVNTSVNPLYQDSDRDGIRNDDDSDLADIFSPANEGWNLSRLSGFSDPAAADVFTEGDTLNVLAWSSVLDANNIKSAKFSLDVNGVKYNGTLSNVLEGTYTGQFLLGTEHVGDAILTIEIRENGKGKNAPAYTPTPIPLTILAVGGNVPPTVSITTPSDGTSFASGELISFSGSANDTEDGDLTASLSWTSDIDGAIGSGASFSAVLSDGPHSITASVTDSENSTTNVTINITVGTVDCPSLDRGSCKSNSACTWLNKEKMCIVQ